jgi:CBS domain containing-hemolysin-like protein
MRDTFSSAACVVNEYGETVGILTHDDILDTILSAEPSRARRLLRREPVEDVGSGRFEVQALTTLRHLSKRLELDFEPDPEQQITVGGLLQEQLEHMPVVGDECLWQGHRIRVIEASGRGPVKVLIARANDPLDDHVKESSP